MKRADFLWLFYILAIFCLWAQTHFVLRYLWQSCHATLKVPVACDESTLLIAQCFLLMGLVCVIAGSLRVKFKNKWENAALLLVSVLAYLLISLFYLYFKTSV